MLALSTKDQDKIKDSIEWAEKNTSGEIRVCIEKKCKIDVLERAVVCFNDLDMHNTRLNNGVLIYVATEDHKFAIIGDNGINALVSSDFWNTTKDLMSTHFKNNQLAEGISVGIIEAGKQLKKYFPYQTDDGNELPNDIVFLP